MKIMKPTRTPFRTHIQHSARSNPITESPKPPPILSSRNLLAAGLLLRIIGIEEMLTCLEDGTAPVRANVGKAVSWPDVRWHEVDVRNENLHKQLASIRLRHL